MTIPWGWIAIFVSLALFYYFNQKTRIRREERRDRSKERHKEYLDSLLDNITKENPPDKKNPAP